jgi:catechol 2,3-dioxygenase-like lactoylglutathione lyase family enzyme
MNIDHVAILVEDLDVSQEWYEKNCGAELVFKDHKFRRMKMENTTIALISKHHYKHAHIGLLVRNYGDLPSNLGEIVIHRDGTTGCYVMDPDGNMVEFIHYDEECKKKMGIEE